MTAIICNSRFVGSELSLLSEPDNSVQFPVEETDSNASDISVWLTDCLIQNNVSVVLYETKFFVDPARYRLVSPHTRFVVLASPGEEETAKSALACGACAVIDKPLIAQNVRGVLDLVSP